MSNGETSGQPSWREFEELAAKIQAELAPNAEVSRNVKVPGKRSGTERQIDVLVEQSVGQYDLRIIIDCKDHKAPVDINDVECFLGALEDVGANKGAMVSAGGFTSTAKKRAKDAGVDLYRLIDAQSTKWQTYVSIPVVMRDRSIRSFKFRFSWTGRVSLPQQDFRTVPVYRADGTKIDILRNLVVKEWDSGKIPFVPGEHRDIQLTSEETYVKTNGQLSPVKVTADVTVQEHLFFGQLGLEEIKGFSDEVNGGLLTSGFVTAHFSLHASENHWEQISSIDQLAVEPVLTLSIVSSPALFAETTRMHSDDDTR